jgi:Fe2+ transport system protein B
MNEQLTKFIELCLADGVISDKEREVIFRKAESLGVDEDECEILIASYTQKVNKKPQPNKEVVSKSKRKITPKTIEKIKPAALDQENNLLDEVAKLKEREKKVSNNYDSVLDDLKETTEQISKIKKENEDDFKKYKASYNKYRKKNITEYFDHVENLISEKYGKAHLIYATKKKEKLSLSDLKTVNNFIKNENNWQKVADGKRNAIAGFIILVLIVFFIYLLLNVFGVEFWISTIILVIIFFLTSSWAQKTYFDKDNLKAVLKITDKKFEKSFKALEEDKNIINKYEKFIKYDLSIPEKKVE